MVSRGVNEVGAALPRFEIGEVLGQGALGIVYRAEDRDLERAVVIKVMETKPTRSPQRASLGKPPQWRCSTILTSS